MLSKNGTSTKATYIARAGITNSQPKMVSREMPLQREVPRGVTATVYESLGFIIVVFSIVLVGWETTLPASLLTIERVLVHILLERLPEAQRHPDDLRPSSEVPVSTPVQRWHLSHWR